MAQLESPVQINNPTVNPPIQADWLFCPLFLKNRPTRKERPFFSGCLVKAFFPESGRNSSYSMAAVFPERKSSPGESLRPQPAPLRKAGKVHETPPCGELSPIDESIFVPANDQLPPFFHSSPRLF